MTREEIQQAIDTLNGKIAQLNSRLHPPPLDIGVRNGLNADLAAAQNSRDALVEALNNLP